MINTPEDLEKTWLQLEGESDNAYRAFMTYHRLNGQKKTVAEAYRTWAEKPPEWRGGASGSFKLWSREHEWERRSTEYEMYLTWTRRRKAEDEHLADLADYRRRMLRYSKLSGNLAVTLLQVLVPQISGLKAKDITVESLPRMVRMVTDLMESSAMTEAQALAVNELIEALDETDQLLTSR